MREQCIILEDEPNLAFLRWQGKKIAAVQHDLSIVGVVESGDQAQGGRLAAPGRTEEGKELSLFERQVNAVHGVYLSERLTEILQHQFRH